jgi:hypothetical protein
MAVLSGAADHVLLFSRIEGEFRNAQGGSPVFLAWPAVPSASRTCVWHEHAGPALCGSLQRYRHEYGLDRRTLGEIALAARAHANLNPNAQMHGRELTMEDYLAGRMIADPYTLFDCCLETDGASAVIVSARNGARDIRILSVAEAQGVSPDDTSNRDPFLESD